MVIPWVIRLMLIWALIHMLHADQVRRKVRNEYGLLMVRDTKFLLQPDGWKDIVLTLELPSFQTVTAEVTFNPCEGVFKDLDKFDFCKDIQSFIENAKHLEMHKRSRLEFLREELKLLLNKPVDKISDRFKRSLIPIIGEVGRNLFGWATLRDLGNIATGIIRSNGYFESSIQKLRNGTLKFVKLFGQELSGMRTKLAKMATDITTSFTIVTEREDNLTNETIHLRAESLWQSFTTAFFSMKLFNIQLIEQDIQVAKDWKDGWTALQGGKISKEFVSVVEMNKIKEDVIKTLRQTGHKVCLKDLSFWYDDMLESFEYTEKNLYLYLRVPYSRDSCHYHLFHVSKWQIPMGHGKKGYNEIVNVPEIMGVRADEKYYMTLGGAQLQTCLGRFAWHCEELFMAHKFTKPSCIWGLWNKDEKIIDRECKYKAKPFKVINSWVKSVLPNEYVIRNPGDELIKKNLINGRENKINCSYCMIKVACGEQYRLGDWTMGNNGNCGSSHYMVKEIMNKPLIKAFNVSIEHAKYETRETHVQLPNFGRYYYNGSEDFEKDLHEMASEMKTVPRREPWGEGEMRDYANQSSGWGYGIIFAYVVAILAAIPGTWALFRQSKLLGTLAILQGMPRVSSNSVPLFLAKPSAGVSMDSTLNENYLMVFTILLVAILIVKIWDTLKAATFWKKQSQISRDMMEPVGIRFGVKIGILNNWTKLSLIEIMELPDYYSKFDIEGDFSFTIHQELFDTTLYLEGPQKIICENRFVINKYLVPAKFEITGRVGSFLNKLKGKEYKAVYYMEKYGKYFTIAVETISREGVNLKETRHKEAESDTQNTSKLGKGSLDHLENWYMERMRNYERGRGKGKAIIAKERLPRPCSLENIPKPSPHPPQDRASRMVASLSDPERRCYACGWFYIY